ncbi:hypothetical protein E2C01_010786 [Portunus trituberculatus]|uniref:Uncharacterized protein n=1 Tax=Portunus trituberculatus TaxID=210409 RepID=A0A5B7D9U1_PORTR|nr:hypothetical protein [Portunus trituberculatus]
MEGRLLIGLEHDDEDDDDAQHLMPWVSRDVMHHSEAWTVLPSIVVSVAQETMAGIPLLVLDVAVGAPELALLVSSDVPVMAVQTPHLCDPMTDQEHKIIRFLRLSKENCMLLADVNNGARLSSGDLKASLTLPITAAITIITLLLLLRSDEMLGNSRRCCSARRFLSGPTSPSSTSSI